MCDTLFRSLGQEVNKSRHNIPYELVRFVETVIIVFAAVDYYDCFFLFPYPHENWKKDFNETVIVILQKAAHKLSEKNIFITFKNKKLKIFWRLFYIV